MTISIWLHYLRNTWFAWLIYLTQKYLYDSPFYSPSFSNKQIEGHHEPELVELLPNDNWLQYKVHSYLVQIFRSNRCWRPGVLMTSSGLYQEPGTNVTFRHIMMLATDWNVTIIKTPTPLSPIILMTVTYLLLNRAKTPTMNLVIVGSSSSLLPSFFGHCMVQV